MQTLKIAVTALLAWVAVGPVSLANADSGEPVVRVSAADGALDGQVDATMFVPAPAAAVYSALTECVRAPEVFPSLKSCRVIEADPARAWDIREHKVASWASFLPDMTTVFRSDYVADRSISFQLISGDLQHLDGSWQLQAAPGGTQVTYQARVGFHALVPSFLVRQSLEADVPKFMVAIRQESQRRAPQFARNPS